MFIRRNMSSNVSYQELKEYACFKQLARVIDVLVLKQILPMVVKKVSLDTAQQTTNRKKMMYIPEDNYQCRQKVDNCQGSTISGTVIDLISRVSRDQPRMKFFMIENKIYNILKYVYHKKIECMEHLKSFEKLNFLYRSDLDEIPFGGYIYRKDDKIQSIYYLVQGEVKIKKTIDEKEINICNIYEGSFFGLYEFGKNKTKRLLNAQSASNNNIVLSISLDLLTELFGKDQEQVLKKMLSLPSEIEKTVREENRKLNLRQKKQQKNFYIKAYEFQRRLNKFSQERNIDRSQSAFGKFVQNKSLLFKIKDSNDFIPRLKQEGIKIGSNFHKNETTQKYYNRLNQHRLYNLDNTISRSFNNKENSVSDIPPALYKPSELLTSRLKQKYDTARKQFTSTGIGRIPSVRKGLVEQMQDRQESNQ